METNEKIGGGCDVNDDDLILIIKIIIIIISLSRIGGLGPAPHVMGGSGNGRWNVGREGGSNSEEMNGEGGEGGEGEGKV